MKKKTKSWDRGAVAFAFLAAAALGAFGVSESLYGKSSKKEFAPEVSDDNFQKEVEKSTTPVLGDFWAVWCGPCRVYATTIEKIAEDYQGKLKVVRVDVDKNPVLSQKYQIRAIPTTLLFKKGKVIKTWVGMVSEGNLKAEVNRVVKPSKKLVPAKL